MFSEEEISKACTDIQLIIMDSLSEVGGHRVTADQVIKLEGNPTSKIKHRLKYLIQQNEKVKERQKLKKEIQEKGVKAVLEEEYSIGSYLIRS